MTEDDPLTHDQLVARVQAFYSMLRQKVEDAKICKGAYGQSPEDKQVNDCRFGELSDLLDIYTHTFEKALYTWLD